MGENKWLACLEDKLGREEDDAGNALAFVYLFLRCNGMITDNSSTSWVFCVSFVSFVPLDISSCLVLYFFSAMAFLGCSCCVLLVSIAVVQGENVLSVGDEYLPPNERGN